MISISRRQFMRGTAALAAAAVSPVSFAQSAGKTRLVLLGTGGGPRVTAQGRARPGTLIVANGVPYVIDCGEGVALQLVRAGIPLDTLRNIFITHHHSDHNLDYGNLIYDAWAAGLKTKVDVYGPPPLTSMTKTYFELNRFDIETRIADEERVDLRLLVNTHQFSRPGVVLQNFYIKVTSAKVRHPPVDQAYAYRFDCPGRSIVISGDTTYTTELVTLAKGADVLVCEAMHGLGIENLVKRVPNAANLRDHLLSSHMLTEDVGRLAAEAGVRTVVLSHLVPGDDPSITDEMWAADVKKHFSGEIIVGKDLMEV